MEPATRAKILSNIQTASEQAKSSIADKLEANFARMASSQKFSPVDAAETALKIIEEAIADFLADTINQTIEVTTEMEAFAQITLGLDRLVREQDEILDVILQRTLNLRWKGSGRAEVSARLLWSSARKRLQKQLALHKFSFSEGPQGQVISPAGKSSTALSKNAGGKPLAEHWDAMWAEIAVQLWTGALIPKRQGDIKKAMFDWLNAHSLEAGDTAVTGRARALWRRMEVEED